MTNAMPQQVITDVTKELVAQIAPHELPIFRTNSQAFFSDPETIRQFSVGVGEAVVYVTPAVMVIVMEVIKFLASEVKKSVATEGASIVNDMVKRMFKKFRSQDKSSDDPPALLPEQVEQVYRLAFEKARQLNLSEAQAELLAHSLVGSLVTTQI